MRCSATTVLPVPGPPSTTRAPREPARMMASWSAWMVARTSRIRGDRLAPSEAMKASSSSRARPALEAVGREDLVPVVADAAARPAVASSAPKAHRVGVGRAEERLGGGGAPVDQQPPAGAVGQAEPSDVRWDGNRSHERMAEAQVEPVAAQGAQAGGEPVDLLVAVQRGLAVAAGRPARGVEAVGQLGGRLRQGLGDRREVLRRRGDEGRVGLGRQAVRKVEGAGRLGVHVVSSVPSSGVGQRFCGMHRGLAARPRVRYTLEVEGRPVASFLFVLGVVLEPVGTRPLVTRP